LAVWTAVWALQRDPDLEIVIISYSDELAQTHSREARKIINEHHVFLGFRLSPDKTAGGGGVLMGIRRAARRRYQLGVTGHGSDLADHR